MRIYLAISYFDQVGGSEEQLTVLATRLKTLGHQVTVFNKMPLNKDSQYVKRLFQSKIRIVAPPDWASALLGNWYTQDRIVQNLSRIASPILFPVAMAASLLRRKKFSKSFESVTGFFRSTLGKVIYRDRQESLMRWNLTVWSFLRKPDVLHLFRFDLHPFLAWAEQHKIPTVYYELITPNSESLRAVDTKSVVQSNINKATLIHAISKSTARTLQNEWGITRPIDVVYPFLKDVPETVEWKKEKDGSPITITCIARLSPEKGIGDLLLAAKSLLGTHPDLNFLIAGSGPLKESLAQQAEELGIAKNVVFYGSYPRSDLPKIMAVTDIFVLPSYLEGLPFVIIEAMAYGKAVVATDVAGVSEVVDHLQTGIIVPMKEPNALCGALLRLVENEALRDRMGLAGREKVIAGNFSVDAFIANVLTGYQKVTQK